jgi:hypothetical protein
MGITAEEVLEELNGLLSSIKYWKECQPHLVPSSLDASVRELIAKVEAIKNDGT